MQLTDSLRRRDSRPARLPCPAIDQKIAGRHARLQLLLLLGLHLRPLQLRRSLLRLRSGHRPQPRRPASWVAGSHRQARPSNRQALGARRALRGPGSDHGLPARIRLPAQGPPVPRHQPELPHGDHPAINLPALQSPNPRSQLQPAHGSGPSLNRVDRRTIQSHPLPQPPLGSGPAVRIPIAHPTRPGRIFGFPIGSLQLQRNSFAGPVQPTDQVAIPTVDLSYNRLSGPISPMFSTVQNLYLNNNRFSGEVPGSLVDRLLAAGMETLYLQHNYLTGIEINPTAEIPVSSSLCLQYNCMVPPLQTPCPLKAGNQKTRPTAQCNEWRG
ncbi:unnamed protein product [Linum tenue]|uniref:Uncharacterized protein n=1 Tax=Linum tenue TaxID=586396 RepID=A0AAV0NC44_9ROSI|nr:unnamed protein product [Linum tenue]